MSEHIKEIDDKSFADAVKEGVTLVDFWAPWCGPCMKMTPILEEVGKELDGKAQICKLNVDENTERAVEFGVTNIPAMLVFKNGVKVGEIIGLHQQAQVVETLEKFI